KISNAEMCVWACGSDHPLDVVSDPPAIQERYVTFAKPGQYSIKVAAMQGKQTVERDQVVEVAPPPSAAALAVVRVQFQASWAKSVQKDHNVKVTFPDKITGTTYPFTAELAADPGTQFTAVKFNQPVQLPYIQNAKVAVAPAGAKVVLTGEFVPGKWD